MRKRLRMKELERATGVGREAIRFYIREGLLPEPERLGRNVALYDESFVERIRLIKDLQRKRYLPLQVIKAIVAGDAPPSHGETEALLALEGKLAGVRAPGRSERLAPLAARCDLAVREIQALAAAGAFDIVTRDGDQWLEPFAVRLVELWARLRKVGFTSERRFSPDQVRLYVEMVRLLAREELRVFGRGVAGRVQGEEAVRMAEEGIDILGEVITILRRETLLRLIAQGNLDAGSAGSRRRPKAS